jgi:hypothetical protein
MTMANDDSSVSSDDDDFMSPFASLRATFPTPKCESETLVASKDSSFIGARMSPVVFDDDDDRNEDRAFIAPFHRALHEPPIHSSFSNERTSLLGRRSVSRPTRTLVDEENVDNRQGQGTNDDTVSHNSSCKKPPTRRWSWGMALCAISGIHLAFMALHDLYVWYLSYRLGNNRQEDVAWRLPLLSPSTSTLVRFGALVPQKVLHGQAWRMITSVCMSTSLVEYVVICGAWYALRFGGSSHSRHYTSSWGLYLLSTVTGQLWTIAWDQSSISGGALWGTCGVLSAAGVATPRQRFQLLFISLSLFMTSMADMATNSFLGVLGSSTFGVASFGASADRVGNEKVVVLKKPVRMLSWIVLVSLWLIPLLWIAIVDMEVDTSQR